jgi:hypothetical protein
LAPFSREAEDAAVLTALRERGTLPWLGFHLLPSSTRATVVLSAVGCALEG